MQRDESVRFYIVYAHFHRPHPHPHTPPHFLDNSPNNQHNCTEKFLGFFQKFSLMPDVLGLPPPTPPISLSLPPRSFTTYLCVFFFFFYQVRGSRQSSLCCQTLPPGPIWPVRKNGGEFHLRYTLNVSRETEREKKEALIGFCGISSLRLLLCAFASHTFFALTSVSHR